MGCSPGHPFIEGAVRLALLRRQRAAHGLLGERGGNWRRSRRGRRRAPAAFCGRFARRGRPRTAREWRVPLTREPPSSLATCDGPHVRTAGRVAPRQQVSPRPIQFFPQSGAIVGTAYPECQRQRQSLSPQRHSNCDTKHQGSGVLTPVSLALRGEPTESGKDADERISTVVWSLTPSGIRGRAYRADVAHTGAGRAG